MTLLQWNFRGFRTHRPDLRHLTSSSNPSIICLQETFRTHHPIPIPNYHFVSSLHSLPISSIVFHHKTQYNILPLQTTVPCTIIHIFLRFWITNISIYFSHSLSIDFSAFSFQPPFLIPGDFNSPHSFEAVSWNASFLTLSFLTHATPLTLTHVPKPLHVSLFALIPFT